ncbi:MAG: alpha/beta hydrolase, partial [Ilumatobacteraceae bacterium]
MPFLSRSDIEIYYERRGEGPPLLLFNGSGASVESSALLIDRLALHFEVLVHDQRGLGRTSVPHSASAVTMGHYAADAAALLDHVGWTSCRVFGISFGGMVALEFAVTHPARVERLALVATSPGGEGGSSYPLHLLAEMPPQERAFVSLRNLDTRFTPSWLS